MDVNDDTYYSSIVSNVDLKLNAVKNEQIIFGNWININTTSVLSDGLYCYYLASSIVIRTCQIGSATNTSYPYFLFPRSENKQNKNRKYLRGTNFCEFRDCLQNFNWPKTNNCTSNI